MERNRSRNRSLALISVLVLAELAAGCHDSTTVIPPDQQQGKPSRAELCGNGTIDREAGEMCEFNEQCGTDMDRLCLSCTCVPLAGMCGNGQIDEGEECETDADCQLVRAGGLSAFREQEPQRICINCSCVGTGDVRVTLTWEDVNDLDLHVIEPSGEEIYYGNETSATGGRLDEDANPGCGEATLHPVENIFWPTGSAPHGTYTVKVNYYEHCQGGAAQPAFTVETFVDGISTVYPGTATTESDDCGLCDTGGCVCQLVTTFTR